MRLFCVIIKHRVAANVALELCWAFQKFSNFLSHFYQVLSVNFVTQTSYHIYLNFRAKNVCTSTYKKTALSDFIYPRVLVSGFGLGRVLPEAKNHGWVGYFGFRVPTHALLARIALLVSIGLTKNGESTDKTNVILMTKHKKPVHQYVPYSLFKVNKGS